MKDEIKTLIEEIGNKKPYYWVHLYLFAYLIKKSKLTNNEILQLIRDVKGDVFNKDYAQDYINTISRDATTNFNIQGQNELREFVNNNTLLENLPNDKPIPEYLVDRFNELFNEDNIIKQKEEVNKEEENLNNNFSLNQILFGPPGTGKTYHTINKAIQIIDNEFYENNKENRSDLKKRFKELKKSKQIIFTTFHQSMSYEEFVEGLKPYEKDGNISYKVEDGIFKQICKQAEENPTEKFVLIIDEINRGNIASIFGELITLIEPDKRKGAEEELSVTLPYSKDEFSVPQNLYIIGTMNTADRSVEALDSALRRRFVFEEMPPDEKLLNKDLSGINLQEVLSKINLRIEKLIDKDHKIGHSYFMNLSNIENLQNAFKNKLIPLLEEYFYGDFVKIGLILGKSFLEIDDKSEKIFKTIDSEEDYTDFESRIIYKIVVPEEETEFINAVKNIYEDDK